MNNFEIWCNMILLCITSQIHLYIKKWQYFTLYVFVEICKPCNMRERRREGILKLLREKNTIAKLLTTENQLQSVLVNFLKLIQPAERVDWNGINETSFAGYSFGELRSILEQSPRITKYPKLYNSLTTMCALYGPYLFLGSTSRNHVNLI